MVSKFTHHYFLFWCSFVIVYNVKYRCKGYDTYGKENTNRTL